MKKKPEDSTFVVVVARTAISLEKEQKGRSRNHCKKFMFFFHPLPASAKLLSLLDFGGIVLGIIHLALTQNFPKN